MREPSPPAGPLARLVSQFSAFAGVGVVAAVCITAR